ncbi:MAG: hypothetical protein U9N61_10440 [Euryarchaeota archaeon]|nr:hypothetical protein [Euryarchaeota archaeon]
MKTPKNELVIPFGLPGLNEIIMVARGNRYASARQKKKYTRLVEELLIQGCIPEEPYRLIDIEFTWTESGRARDPDNVRAGAKFILDAMVNQAIIVDDSMKYIKLLADKFKRGKKRAVSVKWTVHEEGTQ